MKIALVSIGKIARDQHIPAIAASADWTLAAAVSRNATVEGVENFGSLAEMLAARPDIGVVSLCMPPAARFEPAAEAIAAGRHVMLEKPPGATLSECFELARLAETAGVSLYATWHSRAAAQVQAARAWLADRNLRRVRVTWKEDVRRWHPGQEWIWQPGGLGVFDPGINALSILTEILPFAVHLDAAVLDFPANRDTPIAAELSFRAPGGVAVGAVFDWRQEGPQTWDIEAETDEGRLLLQNGGATLSLDGGPAADAPDIEYATLYKRMAELVAHGRSDVDLAPMMHVADAFTLGRRRQVAAFDW
ncbi:Gfo/Idh/MocA family protein [Frigidibacter sp. ROC022]|uniref:Gfo/Idh/MocA family protein n=1 Tax=Frigidibacter sp. ROC022 TaxID=2971796 RepID=UPI00215A2748|nr:Gfo/Idh/MocA family oxidoreductase [Frigidibacter sp. ROC022]MCR8726795.1 Gfo/Idh/MocA family oxidoreductase [Frigidibacter sp. ROC022]